MMNCNIKALNNLPMKNGFTKENGRHDQHNGNGHVMKNGGLNGTHKSSKRRDQVSLIKVKYWSINI